MMLWLLLLPLFIAGSYAGPASSADAENKTAQAETIIGDYMDEIAYASFQRVVADVLGKNFKGLPKLTDAGFEMLDFNTVFKSENLSKELKRLSPACDALLSIESLRLRSCKLCNSTLFGRGFDKVERFCNGPLSKLNGTEHFEKLEKFQELWIERCRVRADRLARDGKDVNGKEEDRCRDIKNQVTLEKRIMENEVGMKLDDNLTIAVLEWRHLSFEGVLLNMNMSTAEENATHVCEEMFDLSQKYFRDELNLSAKFEVTTTAAPTTTTATTVASTTATDVTTATVTDSSTTVAATKSTTVPATPTEAKTDVRPVASTTASTTEKQPTVMSTTQTTVEQPVATTTSAVTKAEPTTTTTAEATETTASATATPETTVSGKTSPTAENPTQAPDTTKAVTNATETKPPSSRTAVVTEAGITAKSSGRLGCSILLNILLVIQCMMSYFLN